ncbi:MAG: radical SAM protein [Candidatus Pacebacteria bacterium]|nr:radical SAM protein [Candidatus Paceibacterota bacterium]
MKTPWLTHQYKKLPSIKKFVLWVKGRKFHILINPSIGSWMALSDKEFAKYEEGKLDSLMCENLYLRQLNQTEEGKVVSFSFPKPANYPSVVVINVTLRCNLFCKYCFAECGQGDKTNDMGKKVIKEIVDQMLQMPETKKITFEFQGGEPLLNPEAIEFCAQYASKQAPKYGKIVSFRVESNGILINQRIIRLLKRYNIKIGISLDGPEKLTNGARVYPNGKGAFQDIWRGIQLLRKNGVPIDGSVCTIGKHNVKHPKEIVDFFRKAHIGFKPRPVNILGRELKNNMAPNDNDWYRCFVKMYHRSKKTGAVNFSIHIFEENVYTPIRDYICLRYPCGAAREIISVNPNGDVFPCDGFKGVQELKMGNILEEPIVKMLQKPWVQKLRNRTAADIPKCRECLFRGMCCSCIYSCYGAFGNIYREDPSHNDRYKIFIFLIKEWLKKNLKNGKDEKLKNTNKKRGVSTNYGRV